MRPGVELGTNELHLSLILRPNCTSLPISRGACVRACAIVFPCSTDPIEIGKRNGMPTLYHQWLLNVMESNLTERVLPLVAPSLMGARVLEFLRLAVDVLYLDSAHEKRETFMELSAYWPLLKPGGLLLGDDFNWRAVSHDAQLFARTHGLQLRSFNNCHEGLRSKKHGGLCVWYLQKPVNERLRGYVDKRPKMRHWLGRKWSSNR